MARLALVSLLVDDYERAIAFFVGALGFELVEDSPATTTEGAPKRWVVVKPPGGECGLLLALADSPAQRVLVGAQMGGRVGFFYHVDDFDKVYEQMASANVEFLEPPRHEEYGQVVVFKDVFGNKWDLLGP